MVLNEQLNGLTTEKNILLNNRLIKGESLRDTLDMFKSRNWIPATTAGEYQ